MTITEKTRAGFANITLRGGRITKWKGEAASCSPQLGSLVLGVSGSALAAALALAPQAAEAGTCTETAPGSGEFVCAGSASPSTPQTINRASPVTVTTEPGFGITTTSGTAISITSTGALTFTDDNASSITGAAGGLSATNNGTGPITITASGTVNATIGTGIRAVGGVSSSGITIDSATALGLQRGIYARHNGSGQLSITSTGLARGTLFEGIYARTGTASSGLAIEANDTTGGLRGIRARHYGSGDLSVVSTGTARGTALDGVYARNSAAGGSLTIEANETEGGLRGIYARNSGSGALSITSTGTARGIAGAGIYARNQGTDLAIEANVATGGIRGIDARNNGSGSLAITSTGGATGATAEGIYARNQGTDLTIRTDDSAGGLRGITALNNGSGALSITSTGLARGTLLDGIYARNQGTSLTIESNDATGLLRGIDARNNGSGALVIRSTGTATGTLLHGIYARNEGTDLTIEAADATGGQRGIFARDFGSGVLSITATGTARGTSGEGIFAENSASGIGIIIDANDALAGTPDPDGVLLGGYAGINAINRGTAAVPAGSTVTNGLTITANNTNGEQYGIRAVNEGTGALTITSNGTANSASGTAILGRVYGEGTDLSITAKDATGRNNGIAAQNYGSGALTISSTGLASGTNNRGISAVNGKAATDITITAQDTSGFNAGINAELRGRGALTITSLGLARGSFNGIFAESIGSGITIEAKDTLGGRFGIEARNDGTGAMSITSTGTAEGSTFTGISATNGAYATDLAVDALNVLGGVNGISALNNGTGALTISSTGAITGTTGSGIIARTDGRDLTIGVNDVTGGIYGIDARNSGPGALSITATGLVRQTTATSEEMPFGRSGINAINASAGTDLTIDVNDASGVVFGVRADNSGSGDLVIRSTGRIEATGTDAVPGIPLANTGIFAFNNTSGRDVTLAVNDVSGARGGIFVDQLGTGAVSVSSTGTVTGNTGIEVRNTAASGPVTIAANNIEAGEAGIRVQHRGRGDLTITTTGLVEANTLGAYGIRAIQSAADGGLIIDAADVTARGIGIRARNYGSGGIAITSSGKITGVTGEGTGSGIIAQNMTGASGAIRIDVNEVQGGSFGIFATSSDDLITVTAKGDVTSTEIGVSVAGAAGMSLDMTNVTGVTFGISARNVGPGTIAITASGDVKATGPASDGIFADGLTMSTDIVLDVNNVSGGRTGITARNDGTGDTTITARGNATGGTASGIFGRNAETARDLSITANDTAGGTYGIEAVNRGTGALTITSTGTARGTSRDGIFALNRGTSLAISAGEAIGGRSGIVGRNYGSGALTIRATGDVTGTNREGIEAVNEGTDLIIEAVNTRGNDGGIFATNRGTGALTVTSTGTARGIRLEGIAATNLRGGTDLTVTSVNAMGATYGIRASNRDGTGSLTVVSTGMASGTGSAGIEALNGTAGRDLTVTAADTSGGFFGIRAINDGRGALSVTSTGTATGAGPEGILAINSAAGTSLTIVANNTSGRNNGIYARNSGSGALSVTSTGTASGRDYRGISANNSAAGTDLFVTANETRGPVAGISATNNGTGVLRITSTGSAIASGASGVGISAIGGAGSSGLSVTSANASGGLVGIYAVHSGSGVLSVTSTGLASGTGARGINVAAQPGSTADIVVSSRDATGGDGIFVSQNGTGSVTVTSTGLATGTRGRGISVGAGLQSTNMTVNAVSATGVTNGIFAGHYGTGSLTVTATGDVSGNNALVAAGGAGNVRVAALNTFGGNTGISASSRGNGAIEVVSNGLARATNANGDAIQVRNDTNGTSISVTSRDAEGGRYGIFARNFGTGALAITTTGTTTGTNRTGIDALNRGTSLTIDAGGAVTGGVDGIRARNYGTAGLTIRTSGNVTGVTGAAINAFNSANDVTASTLIEQAAGTTSTGATNGLTAVNAGGSLTVRALGTLVGTAGSGLAATNEATATGMTLTVANASGAVSGIAANNLGSGPAAITLTGTAQGGTGAAIDTRSAAGNLTTITLGSGAQALAGASGVAIANNEGASALVVAAGARIAGEVRLGAGNDTATFNGPNSLAGITLLDGGADIDALTLNGLVGTFNPAQIANWETITFAAQSNVSATGLAIDNLVVTDSTGRFTTLAAGTLTTGNAQVSLVGASTVNAISACGGALTLGGTTAVGAAGIQGCARGETITLEGDARVAGNIAGAGGSDTIAVLGNASVAGTIFGGGAGSDNSAASDGTNTITIATTASVGAVEGGIGSDIITLASGRVIGGVQGGAGNDTVNWNAAAATTPLIAMGAGSDTININSAAVVLANVTLDGGSGPAGKVDTLNLNAGWSGDLVGARVTNWDAINVNGGMIRFTDAALTAGILNINDGGRLNASNNLVLTGSLALVSGGRLLAGNATGNNTVNVSGNLANGGLIDLRGPGGQTVVGDRLIIGGNYTGLAGGSLVLDAVLGGSHASDQVVVRGNLTGANTVVVNNVGGIGGLTTGDGIRLVQVDGTSAAGALSLAGGAVDAGAYRYELFLGGIANPGRSDWFLRSRARDTVVAAMSVARLSQDIGLTALGTMNERLGEQEHLALKGGESGVFKGIWGRAIGKDYSAEVRSAGLGDTRSNGRIGGLQMGVDLWRGVAANGARTHVGVFAGHMWSSSDDGGAGRDRRLFSSTVSEGWLVGGYVTHIAPSGFYVDAVVQHDGIDHRLNGLDGTRAFTQSNTTLASLELGRAFGTAWKFEPQAQLVYASSRVDNFADTRAAAFRLAVDDSVIARGGFRLKRTWDHDPNSDGGLFTIYAKTNVWGRLSGGEGVLAVGVSAPGRLQTREAWGDVGIGTTFSLSRGAEIFTDFEVEYGFDQGGTALAGRGGLRLRF